MKEKEAKFFFSRSLARILFSGPSPSSTPIPTPHASRGKEEERPGKGLPPQPGSKARGQEPENLPHTLPNSSSSLFLFFHTNFPFHLFACHLVRTTGLEPTVFAVALSSLLSPAFLQNEPPDPGPLHTPPCRKVPRARGALPWETWQALGVGTIRAKKVLVRCLSERSLSAWRGPPSRSKAFL